MNKLVNNWDGVELVQPNINKSKSKSYDFICFMNSFNDFMKDKVMRDAFINYFKLNGVRKIEDIFIMTDKETILDDRLIYDVDLMGMNNSNATFKEKESYLLKKGFLKVKSYSNLFEKTDKVISVNNYFINVSSLSGSNYFNKIKNINNYLKNNGKKSPYIIYRYIRGIKKNKNEINY